MADRGLRGRGFFLLWSGNALPQMGFHSTRIASPLLVLTLTGSPTAAGWVGFALGAPSLVFQLTAGTVADRFDPIRTLRVCQCCGLTVACAVAVAVWLEPPGLVLLIVAAAFVEGTVLIFAGMAELAAVRDIVPESGRARAFSFLEAEQPIASLAGRAAGGAILGLARWLPYAVGALCYAYAVVALSSLRRNGGSRAVESHSRTVNLRDGVRTVWYEPLLRATTLALGCSNMIIQLVLLLILFELGTGGWASWVAGLVLAAAGVGGILGAMAAGRLATRYSAGRIYRAGLWVWAALLLPMALTNHPVVLGLCWGGVGAVGVAGNVALTTYRVEVIPAVVLGRSVSIMELVASGAGALGALGAGYLVFAAGTVVAGWISVAAMVGLATVMTWPRLWSRRPIRVA